MVDELNPAGVQQKSKMPHRPIQSILSAGTGRKITGK